MPALATPVRFRAQWHARNFSVLPGVAKASTPDEASALPLFSRILATQSLLSRRIVFTAAVSACTSTGTLPRLGNPSPLVADVDRRRT